MQLNLFPIFPGRLVLVLKKKKAWLDPAPISLGILSSSCRQTGPGESLGVEAHPTYEFSFSFNWVSFFFNLVGF